ncbi:MULTISPECIES: Eco57I restriction-modification methylase domain-containing protein [unclassified Imperialibacter]|uniref:class I SAM-dependent DNA methyltransferase n=1 Tax=unclassified Imperialibacter TaxID=2629706 RepID=UPI001252D9EC|nr:MULTISPECIES: Eco57I restriction-modification methylase domain-containing protein [unclassified Imperialibacter]CAD5258188.1 Type II restriction endonuclease [Imperialibacter sp. 89]CAD5273259.1 Type II restriction endonuclease [Imperialibacter sp. 75]VVT32691.1 Type II restriction endonuclease [Imperialibacter sp. EC-SDR9]
MPSIQPRKALNKAYLKVKPSRAEIEKFKTNLIGVLDQINEGESEEFHKNLVSDFLKKTYYDPAHSINTKGRNDMVIHNGKDGKSTVGVILEAKKPSNKGEMLKQENINGKALQELVLYYLRERITSKNLEIKHIVATNINEWFIFDGQAFEKAFAQNKALVKQFTDFEEGRLGGTKTDFFYKEIASPAIEAIKDTLEFAYFDIREYDKTLRNADKTDDNKLIALYKLLAPEHLLKLPFANDSNSLDKSFYSELLHIIGLTETKEGGKKIIERKKAGERNVGSLLENAIVQLDSLDKLSRLEKPSQYGNTTEERLFTVGLELVITWVNRILFLKLLEAQLITYHKGDKSYAFLSHDRIHDYDDLNSLFFSVLAKKESERDEEIKQAFAKVPYLNSSLFEPTEMEHTTIFISNLRNERNLPVLSSTVLKTSAGKKLTGELDALTYFFEFLNAYDFSSEGSEDIQEDNKTLINASVLGLIFEKINGYKDGSFFTPGFITMYMCRETIRRAVVQKFREAGYSLPESTDISESFNLLYDLIEPTQEGRTKANDIVNSLKICDPAVGSGHFLVSALNELIAIKSDLHILQDTEGRRLKEYQLEVVNDELIVTDEDGELFDYVPGSKESQRIQETLFHEKQTIIENCLFGVDINPNSVKICRLRLWIELLKSAYYRPGTEELETLPNIDINIKTGNSLISRFTLDADIKQALKKSKWSIDSYRLAVQTYREAKSKEEKREMERLIDEIKSNFKTEIRRSDPVQKRLDKLGNDLFMLTGKGTDGIGMMLFEPEQEYGKDGQKRKEREKRIKAIEDEINKLAALKEDAQSNKIYENAFEWRFEFPEVLSNEGDFVGFDVVIGNPPYIRQEELSPVKPYLSNRYRTFSGTADLFVFFVELAMDLLKDNGEFIYIIPNKWMRAGYGKKLRNFVKMHRIHRLMDFGDLPVFEEATTYPCIIELSKTTPTSEFEALNHITLEWDVPLPEFIKAKKMIVLTEELDDNGWTLTDSITQKLLAKIRANGTPLGEFVNGKIFYGIKTGLNEAFVIDGVTRDRLINDDPNSADIIKPFLAGRDVKRYEQPSSDKFLILLKNGDTKEWFGEVDEKQAALLLLQKYPAIMGYLKQFEKPAKARYDQGQFWWELRACDYYEEFDKEKILWPGISSNITSFALDNLKYYGNDNNQMIITSDLVILAILNSSVSNLFLRSVCDFVRGGFARLKIVYVEKIPIPSASDNQKEKIEQNVRKLLEIRRKSGDVNTTKIEKEIDNLVYELYHLTEDEIKIIEGQ